jgi:hypothetical protein
MAWQVVNGRKYYYRAVRRFGRPRRVYVGAADDPAAELAAAADHLRRLQREAAARERQAEQAPHRDAEAALRALCERTDVLTRAALLAAGFRRHHRGQWRRRREPEPTG